ncbi:acyl-CoA dehydrogenase family protein [Paracoccus sp. DMF]|uniref:acyl-CoA dehydrogenase family protein n=1 Tax=Paracoccus sp. DMF TaxID=400837 RepID=UPI00110344B0|nr:acyl-CoA dehydrogenase family protein [Paracoccus sp. DMF]
MARDREGGIPQSLGADAAAIRARARRDGDHFVLDGEKASVTLVMAAHAGIVFARTDPEAGRAVCRPLVPFDDPGVRAILVPI